MGGGLIFWGVFSRLNESYGAMINSDTALENKILEIKAMINALPDDNPKNQAAKNCLARLTDPNYTHTDPGSNISTRQLLALTFIAIHDDAIRAGNINDAIVQFVEGLYEIQRGYNINARGIDSFTDADIPICISGTFNKLMEKLNGIHPDVSIEFITQELATIKLPIVVKAEVNKYLATKANAATVTEYLEFTQLIKQIATDGIEVIWHAIKNNVSNIIFDEFKSLYNDDPSNPNFIDLIDAGEYTILEDLSSFQKELSESAGCRKYHSMIMRLNHSVFQKQNEEPSQSDDLDLSNRI